MAFAILLLTSGISFGQTNASTGVPLSASVIQGLTISSSGTLSFGNIVAGTTPGSLSAQSSPSAPLITVTGNGGSTITVTYSGASLTGPGAAITFTPSVYGANLSSNQSGSTGVLSGGTVQLSGTTGSAGNYFFWLGGSLSALPAGQAPGNYTGTWTMSVSY